MAKAKKPRSPAQIENEKNLRPFRTSEEARIAGAKGRETQRRRRTMAETMQHLLDLPLRGDESIAELQSLADASVQRATGKKAANVTVAEAILLAQIKEALAGNVQAARFVRELMPQTEMAVQEDDGFLDALNATAAADWEDGDDGSSD